MGFSAEFDPKVDVKDGNAGVFFSWADVEGGAGTAGVDIGGGTGNGPPAAVGFIEGADPNGDELEAGSEGGLGSVTVGSKGFVIEIAGIDPDWIGFDSASTFCLAAFSSSFFLLASRTFKIALASRSCFSQAV